MFLFDRFDQHRVGFLSDVIICQMPGTEYHLKLKVGVRSCFRASSPDMRGIDISNRLGRSPSFGVHEYRPLPPVDSQQDRIAI